MSARPRRSSRRLLAFATLLLAVPLFSGCGTQHPPPLERSALSEAQTFPYYKLYWVGPSFLGEPLAAVDGLRNYSAGIGDSVYYGDCVTGKGLLGGGGNCQLPLQVTTVIYRLHSNSPLGPQRNAQIRGVPATIYDEGHTIELYSGRLAIDVFSNTPARALLAANQLLPINAPGSAAGKLPPPVYCPGLSGPVSAELQGTLSHLPGRPCQKTQAALAAAERLAAGR
ncbi:MAG TPA: hypothetical protein VK781_06350 [Solirubrobacteraceae bacterium]|jgi:hypothetical protein|nr:hypothetical protein [Solirubrobacteraceae bacterium]